jgi:hypothetical protein
MYHVEPNYMDGIFLEAYTCSDCGIAYQIESSPSGKTMITKWIDLNPKDYTSE